MSEIQFEEDVQQSYQASQKSFLIRFVLRTGIVSTDQAAEYILLGVAIVLILLAFIVPSFFGVSTPKIPSGTIIINTPGIPPHLLAPN